jgi:hypothetical protein
MGTHAVFQLSSVDPQIVRSTPIAEDHRFPCDLQMREVPATIQGFAKRHEGHYPRQLAAPDLRAG